MGWTIYKVRKSMIYSELTGGFPFLVIHRVQNNFL